MSIHESELNVPELLTLWKEVKKSFSQHVESFFQPFLSVSFLTLATREMTGGLTEHHLQPHQTRHEVVEVDGHVGVGVSSHQQLVDGVVESETCRMTGSVTEENTADTLTTC